MMHQGKEICFNFNESDIAIVDVTARDEPETLSETSYVQFAYTHQGWVTEDHQYLLVDDESDERNFGVDTTTLIFDIRDLDNPQFIDSHVAPTPAIDHNQYIHLGYSFQSNYRAGLRILDTADVANGNLEEIGYFETLYAHILFFTGTSKSEVC